MLDGASRLVDTHVQKAISLVFPEVPNLWITTRFCWCIHPFILFNICATTWVYLWFIADYNWGASTGGKVLNSTSFSHALYDESSFPALKAKSYGELSMAVSGEIGWCSTISKMQCIFEFHVIETSFIDVTWWGFLFLGF